MDDTLQLREFDIAEVSWQFHSDALRHVRRLVFILEQKISPDEEWVLYAEGTLQTTSELMLVENFR